MDPGREQGALGGLRGYALSSGHMGELPAKPQHQQCTSQPATHTHAYLSCWDFIYTCCILSLLPHLAVLHYCPMVVQVAVALQFPKLTGSEVSSPYVAQTCTMHIQPKFSGCCDCLSWLQDQAFAAERLMLSCRKSSNACKILPRLTCSLKCLQLARYCALLISPSSICHIM